MPATRRTSSRSKKSDRHIAKIAKKVLYKNSETKCKMAHFNELSFNTTTYGAFYDPMLIQEGTGPDNRIGNLITLSGYQVKGVLKSNATTTHQYVRMVVFYAKDRTDMGDGSEMFVNSLHNPLTSATIGGLDKIYHPLNKSLVTPLYDKVHRIAPDSSANSDGTKFFNFFIKLKNRKVSYENSTGGGSENVSPRLHFAVFTADAGDDDINTTIEMSALGRLWFKDI